MGAKLFRVSRWWCLAFSCLIETVAGINFIVGIFSNQMKLQLGLSQEQISLIVALVNLGAGFAIPQGYINDFLGPRYAILCGCVCLCSYLVIWAMMNAFIPHNYVLLCVVAFIAGTPNSWLDNTVCIANAKNFPKQKGIIIGLLSSLLGLSASINSQIYVTFFQPDWIGFLFYIAIGLCGIVLFAVVFVNETNETDVDRFQGNTNKRLTMFVINVAVLAGYLQAASFTQRHLEMHAALPYWFTAGMILIFSVFFTIPWLWRDGSGAMDHQRMVDDGGQVVEMKQLDDSTDNDNQKNEVMDKMVCATPESKTVKATLRDVKFWLLFLSLPIGSGAGIMVFANIGQVVESLGGAPGAESGYVSALGIASCLGRLGTGVLSSKLEGRIPRPWLFFGAMVIATISQFLLTFSSLQSLYLACVFTGLAYGTTYAGLSPMLADFFGFKYMGVILSLMMTAPMASGIFTSRFLASWVYVAHSVPGSTRCFGKECFQTAFAINGVACLVACVLSFVLCMISKRLYVSNRVIKQHNNNDNNNNNKEADNNI